MLLLRLWFEELNSNGSLLVSIVSSPETGGEISVGTLPRVL
jgi:hypothetical protein